MAARGPALAVVCARGYHEAVHDHFSPRNVGSLDKNDAGVGAALVGKASCGDVFKLQVKVEDGVIVAQFKTFSRGSAIASRSLATEMIIGRHLDGPPPAVGGASAAQFRLGIMP